MSRLFRWVRSLGCPMGAKEQRTSKAKPPGFWPRLEILEDRTVMSTLTVLNTADHGAGSLRDTIAAALPGDTIQFAHSLSGKTINLSTELAISSSLNIQGPGANQLTISGNDVTRVFDITGGNVTIAGVTIAHGKEIVTTEGDGGGGILNSGSTLTLRSDVVSDCQATASAYGFDVLGGGLLNINNGSVTIQSCTFDSNQATGGGGSGTFAGGSAGGGVDNEGGVLVVGGSTFSNNEVFSAAVAVSGTYNFATGGALMSEAGVLNNNPATATITTSTFSDNLATGGASVTGEAGGICSQSAVGTNPGLAKMTIDKCTVISNQAVGGPNGTGVAYSEGIGGGILNTGVIIINNSTIANNQAIGGAGSVPGVGGFASPATGAGQAGGISNDTGIMTINNCAVAGNQAIGANTASGPGGIATGGGIDCWGIALAFPGILHVSNSIIWDNQAIAGTGGPGTSASQLGFAAGGGIDIAFSSVADVANSIVAGNRVTGSSGGAGVNGGIGEGAGICLGFSALFSTPTLPVVDQSTLQLTNTLLSGNVAQGGAGGTGASGGTALGGGLAINAGCSATIRGSLLIGNQAIGGAGGAGANGGDGLGGGLFISNGGTASVTKSVFEYNTALGGKAGSGGQDGQGHGGGVYYEIAGAFVDDPFTLIKKNRASTSGDDIFLL